MLGDKLNLQPHHYTTAQAVLEHLLPHLPTAAHKPFCLSIGGESGSGKSVLALCLAELLTQKGITNLILHQDDYFKLPPETNRLQRAKDLAWVGVNEVQLDLLNQHLAAFKQGQKSIAKPLVIFDQNRIEQEILPLDRVQVLIVEGTYSSLLPTNCCIFMARNYIETQAQRIARGRDVFDDNLNKILEIEHQIIAQHAQLADIYIDKNYEVQIKNGLYHKPIT